MLTRDLFLADNLVARFKVVEAIKSSLCNDRDLIAEVSELTESQYIWIKNKGKKDQSFVHSKSTRYMSTA